MRHLLAASLLCLLCPLGATPARAQDTSAVTSALRVGRLELDLPASWKRVPSPSPKAVRVSAGPGVELLLLGISRYAPGEDLAGALNRFAAQVTRGWAAERQLPPERGATAAGFAFALRGRLGRRGEERRVILTAAVAIGGGYQALVLTARDPQRFSAAAPALVRALQGARVRFPLSELPAAQRGAERAFLHLRYALPPALRAVELKDAPRNRAAFTLRVALPEGAAWDVPILLDLQPFVPDDTGAALSTWLDDSRLGVQRREGTSRARTAQADRRLARGLQLSRLVVEDRGPQGWLARRAGLVALGSGWSLFVGAAVGDSDPFWKRLKAPQREALGRALGEQVLPRLTELAASVGWGAAPKARPDLVQRLQKKARYRYRTEFLSSGEFSFSSTRTILWTFASDGTCTYEQKGFSAFLDTTPDAYGTPRNSSGTLSKDAESLGKPRFEVVSLGEECYLVVRAPRSFGRLHRLEFDKVGDYGASKGFVGLAIDGRIEGSYYSGDDYGYRKD